MVVVGLNGSKMTDYNQDFFIPLQYERRQIKQAFAERKCGLEIGKQQTEDAGRGSRRQDSGEGQ